MEEDNLHTIAVWKLKVYQYNGEGGGGKVLWFFIFIIDLLNKERS